MKVGVYPFKSTENIENNLAVIEKAIRIGAEKGIRLLVFHECALCGYPPIETSIECILKENIDRALNRIAVLAKEFKMFIAVGTIRFQEEKRYNSMVLFNDYGNQIGTYDKTALWGWDCSNFHRGNQPGVFEIDGVKVGFRICFDVRFPETFRMLYKRKVELCFVLFSDTDNRENLIRYQLISSFLATRAMENLMTIISVNSIYNFQTAPTAVFDVNGNKLKETPLNGEVLLTYDYEPPEMSFGMRGRVINNTYFLKNSEN